MTRSFAWYIYELTDLAGGSYIGATKDLARRMREHKKRFGFTPKYRILEAGHSIEWRSAEHRWIEKFRSQGVTLLNLTAGGEGVQTLSKEARQKLSAFGRGRPKPASHGAKISAAQKGQPRQWSPEGAKRVAATQFAPGHNAWEKISEEARAEVVRRAKAQWEGMPPAERSAKAADRASTAWSKRSKNERQQIGRRISAARLSIPAERRSELSRLGALARLEQPDAAQTFGHKIKNWWAGLSAAEKRDFVQRRAVAIAAAKSAKRAVHTQTSPAV